jgi:hypothetical protein
MLSNAQQPQGKSPRQIVDLDVAGSSPVTRPIFINSQEEKAAEPRCS